MEEATSPEAEPNNYDGGWKYDTLDPITDWAEKSRLDAIDAFRARGTKESPMNMNGLMFPVVKRLHPKS